VTRFTAHGAQVSSQYRCLWTQGMTTGLDGQAWP